jgi:hypothetical protein
LSAKKHKEVSTLLEGVTWILVDEVSMLTAEMLGLISIRCKQFGPKPEMDFGGFKFLFIGDFAVLLTT